MMMRSIGIIVEYDGTDFCGWQVQPNGRSVQAELENAVKKLTGETVKVFGAGRTDAGVHARGQVAVFRTESAVPAENFHLALNSRLPADVCVCRAWEAKADFNPRYGAKMKLYRYTLHNSPVRPALGRRYSWHVKFPLDLEKMRAAAALLQGRHDFTSFSNQERNKDEFDNVREISSLEIARAGETVTLDFEGRSFLYNMVRNLTGTLVDIGCGRIAPDAVPAILAARNRAAAGQGAPACGLCLEWVRYDGITD